MVVVLGLLRTFILMYNGLKRHSGRLLQEAEKMVVEVRAPTQPADDRREAAAAAAAAAANRGADVGAGAGADVGTGAGADVGAGAGAGAGTRLPLHAAADDDKAEGDAGAGAGAGAGASAAEGVPLAPEGMVPPAAAPGGEALRKRTRAHRSPARREHMND